MIQHLTCGWEGEVLVSLKPAPAFSDYEELCCPRCGEAYPEHDISPLDEAWSRGELIESGRNPFQ